jgi:DNA gyrase subunit A
MEDSGCHYNKPYRKSARIVGEVMGKYHPHGDAAIYDSLVRMAQDFSLRLPLIDGQGNFGSIDKDDPAAMRYTESRLERVTHTMLEDIDKDSVNFVPNYDGSEKEPSVLPARFPNLLANGSEGIAVGMATSIPPHNLGELIDSCLAILDNPSISIDNLMKIIPAPDFPTGAEIIANSGISTAFKTGRGSVKMRAVSEINTLKNGKSQIIVTEIPYQVVKAYMIENIASLVRNKKIDGITGIQDESNKEGIRIVIDIKKDFDANVILNQLYKMTQLECNFSYNMLALNKGKPQLMNLKTALTAFVEFREETVVRRTEFLLNKAKDKAHILIGLTVAVDFIDRVIEIIRGSKDTNEAKNELLSKEWQAERVTSLIELVGDKKNNITDGKFKFTEEQVKAILEIRLSKLTGMERDKIIEDLKVLADEVREYVEILSNRVKLISIIKDEMQDIKNKFATERRSKIIYDHEELDTEDLIQKEDIMVSFTLRGYIKRDSISSYEAQKRGGKGKKSMKIGEDDCITDLFCATTHSIILFFSDIGRVYRLKGYKIPVGSSSSKGRALVNLLNLSQGEKITNFLALPESKEERENLNLIFATKNGLVRRSGMESFESINSSGKIAMGLNEGDELIGVKIANNNDHIMLATKNGLATRFSLDSVRVTKSRSSSGMIGMRLSSQDEVVSVSVLGAAEKDVAIRSEYLKIPLELRDKFKDMDDSQIMSDINNIMDKKINISPELARKFSMDEEFILTITENGFGKRSSAHEYRIANRGGKGVKNIITSDRNGSVIATFIAHNDEDVIMLSSSGKVVRCNASQISIVGRSSQGVRLMSTEAGEKIITASMIKMMDESNCEEEEV